MGGEDAQGEALSGDAGAHLGAVVAHSQQDRLGVLDGGVVVVAGLDGLPEVFGVERVAEDDLDAAGGLLAVRCVASHMPLVPASRADGDRSAK